MTHQDPSHISDGQYDTSGWEIDQSGFKPAEEKQWRKKKAKKVVEKKEEVAREKPVLTDDIELTMDDALYQVDPRAASVLGGSGSSSVVYENPMKKKKEFHGPSDGKGSVPPSHEVRSDESQWLFH